MESQFGIANVWIQGDFVTRAVAILLLAMSLASWIVILIKALDIIKFKKHARAAQDFWHSEDFAAGLTKLGADPTNPFRHLALEGREATAHHRNTKAHLHDALDAKHLETGARAQDLPLSAEKAAHHPAQSGLGDGHHLHPHGTRVHLSGCRARLVHPARPGMAGIDHAGG